MIWVCMPPVGVSQSRAGPLVVVVKVNVPLAGATTVPVHRTENPLAGTVANAGVDDPPGAYPFHVNRIRSSTRLNEGFPESVAFAKYVPLIPPPTKPCAAAAPAATLPSKTAIKP
jgi:hypothetical protein